VRFELVFERNTSPSYLFHWEVGLIAPSRPIWLCLHVPLHRKTSVLEAAGSSALFPCENEVIFERILPANHNFQVGERLILFKQKYSTMLKKHMYVSKENHVCKKLQHPCKKQKFNILLPCEN
jgi:hypothetical protein